GGAGRKPAVVRNNVNPAMCNRTDVIIATTSWNTGRGRERVAVTAWARGAFFGVGGAVMSPGYGVVSAAGTLSRRPAIRMRTPGSARLASDGVGGESVRHGGAQSRLAHLCNDRMALRRHSLRGRRQVPAGRCVSRTSERGGWPGRVASQ